MLIVSSADSIKSRARRIHFIVHLLQTKIFSKNISSSEPGVGYLDQVGPLSRLVQTRGRPSPPAAVKYLDIIQLSLLTSRPSALTHLTYTTCHSHLTLDGRHGVRPPTSGQAGKVNPLVCPHVPELNTCAVT